MSWTAWAARLGVAAGVVGFWTAAAVAARGEPGYDPSVDYLSALAAVGAIEPSLGLLMFGSGTAVLVASAGVVRQVQPDARAAPVMLLGAAACVAVAGLARVTCLEGVAGCNAGPLVLEQTTGASRVHSVAVAGYQVALSAALAVLAERARRNGRRALAVLGWAAAVVTPVLAFNPLGLPPGWGQRLWVLSGHAVLLALAAWPSARAADPV